MGSLTLPKLSRSQIVQLYRDELKPLSWLSLRAGLTHYKVRDILQEEGVAIRSQVEVTVLRTAERKASYKRRLDRLDSRPGAGQIGGLQIHSQERPAKRSNGVGGR